MSIQGSHLPGAPHVSFPKRNGAKAARRRYFDFSARSCKQIGARPAAGSHKTLSGDSYISDQFIIILGVFLPRGAVLCFHTFALVHGRNTDQQQ